MGMFDNEDTFLTKQRDLRRRYVDSYGGRGEQNMFRALGGAFKRYELEQQRAADIEAGKEKEALVSQVDPTNPNELMMGAQIANEKGYYQLSQQFIDQAAKVNQILPKQKTVDKWETQSRRLDQNGRTGTVYFDVNQNGQRSNVKYVWDDEVKGTAEEPKRQYQYRRTADGWQFTGERKYAPLSEMSNEPDILWSTEKPSMKKEDTSDPSWERISILGPDGKPVMAEYSKKGKEGGVWAIPGVGRVSSSDAIQLGYNLTDQGKAVNGENLQARVFYNPTTKQFGTGYFDPSPDSGQRFLVDQEGNRTPLGNNWIDVSYRLDKVPGLAQGDAEELQARSSSVVQFNNLIGTFDDEFGGYGFEWIGDAWRYAGEKLPDEKLQAMTLWWKEHDRLKNKMRNDLFGSALTATEKAAFDAITVNPAAHPDIIRANLAAQFNIARDAAVKIVNFNRAKGIPEAQLRNVVGDFVYSLAKEDFMANNPPQFMGMDEDGDMVFTRDQLNAN